MHTIRHSFVTHCWNKALIYDIYKACWDMKIPKQHKYIHITKGFDQIKSPLDLLDIYFFMYF